jgi:hypothetical protein
MPKAITCLLDGKVIGINEALQLRDDARQKRRTPPNCLCRECGEPVRPHSGGGHTDAHFEHLARNPNCDLSDILPDSPARAEREFDLQPGYWVAQSRAGAILACCRTPEELDKQVMQRGESPDNVLLLRVPLEDDDVLGGVDIEVS